MIQIYKPRASSVHINNRRLGSPEDPLSTLLSLIQTEGLKLIWQPQCLRVTTTASSGRRAEKTLKLTACGRGSTAFAGLRNRLSLSNRKEEYQIISLSEKHL